MTSSPTGMASGSIFVLTFAAMFLMPSGIGRFCFYIALISGIVYLFTAGSQILSERAMKKRMVQEQFQSLSKIDSREDPA